MELNEQQFFHGTRRSLEGKTVRPGIRPNFVTSSPGHVYMAPTLDDAIGWAKSAQGRGRERVYQVEPAADVEQDPEWEQGASFRASGAKVRKLVWENTPPPEEEMRSRRTPAQQRLIDVADARYAAKRGKR